MNNVFHVIKDPVHGTMQFTSVENAWVKPFIDSPNFQRLRHIKQLGMGDFIFPGAVHTRFNHCLGCCYIASQIAAKIGLSEEERQLVIIAGLLHDIGHGPFSHAFEDIFHAKLIRHEDWTPFFLADYRSGDFFARYNRENPRHHLTAEKFRVIEDMIMHKTQTKHVLADIVSSQLDADRFDYLLRDSHFCGVAYGQFDLRWMLHCLAIVNAGDGERLGITHKGIGGVEHYLMARRLMTRNIYHSQKKLALEFLLIKLLMHIAEGLEDYAPFAELKKTRLGKFLWEVNNFNHAARVEKNLQTLKKNFLENHFENYKGLYDYDIFAVVKMLAEMSGDHPAIQIAQRIERRVMPKIIRLDFANLAAVETRVWELQSRKIFPDWQFALLKTPHQSYSIEEDPILVTDETGSVKPISELSLMINAISDKHESTAFLCVDAELVSERVVREFLSFSE